MRRLRVFWEAFKNSTLNFLRYAFIACLFLYLLTAVVLFNDIMAFHDRVAEDVGDDGRARRVVLMLHRIHENPEQYPPGEEELPVGTLAVTLGSLQSTHRNLTRFEYFSDAQPETPGDAQEDQEDQEKFEDLQEQIEEQVETFEDLVTKNIPEANILNALKGFEDAQALAQALHDESDAPLEARLNSFEQNLADLRTSLIGEDTELPAYDYLRSIKQRLERLKTIKVPADEDDAEIPDETIAPIDFAGQMDLLKSDIQGLRSKINALPNIDTERDKLSGFIALIDQATTKPINPGSISTYAEDIEQMHLNVEEMERTLAFSTVTPVLGEQLAAMDILVEEARTASRSNDEKPPSLEERLNNIESALERRFPANFPAAAGLIDDIGGLRQDLAKLKSVDPGVYLDPNDGRTTGEEAKDRFDETMKSMGADLDKIEEKLLKQGRVIALANVLEEDENESAKGATIKASGILQDFDALKRFGPLMLPLSTWISPRSALAQFGLNPQRLATLTTDSITTIYVFLIGAIGSLIYITKYQLKLVIDGHRMRMPPPRPLPWFLFRPIFGIVVALALYYIVRAGQMAFGASGDGEVGTTLNIPILSVMALFAGILSWQALAAIEARGGQWFSAQTRQPLWATGLGHALRTTEKSIAECAQQVGRSPEQIERWLMFRDKVTIEMQDRIRTWIELRPDELFGENKPHENLTAKAMWAVGLKAALDSREKRIDAEALVELLREEKRPENIERIKGWITLKLQVPPATQWRLVDLLDVPHHVLFASELQDSSVWGTRLRRAIEDRKERTEPLAARMGLDAHQLHEWKELEHAIPPAMQERLMRALDRTFTDLFEVGDLESAGEWFLRANDLQRALRRRSMEASDFAHQVDVEPDRVERWIDGEAIAKPTRETIIRVLGGDDTDLFQRRMLADGTQAGTQGVQP